MLRRPFISELLNTLVTEKFGSRTNDDDFSGPSDASEAPGNFLINFGGSNYVVTPEVDNSSPVEQSPVSHSVQRLTFCSLFGICNFVQFFCGANLWVWVITFPLIPSLSNSKV